ncbi:Actin/actin-like protein [Hesseltinella vesiculosa]|uniref:Actin/actin-like protein n=1 Tax=Hesseltinella vesiculosa TaxID=101127 RepID=A0A1X2GDK7_9FUNG|nr:Actin/actin-like protein [Hesseltinella vesiculosa]
MVTYGGDEVNALVLDIGTSNVRAGYAGEDTPKVMFPTSVGYLPSDGDVVMSDSTSKEPSQKYSQYYIGDNKINKPRPGMQIINPMEDGLVNDWDTMEAIWDATFNSFLRVDPTEHPLLCTEPAWNTTQNREKLAEIAFETFDFPAFYLAKDAVMSAFSVGRATALVLDSGGGMTSAVPVYDGYVLKKGILRSPIAGNLLTQQILDQLESDLNVSVTPSYKVKTKAPVGSGQPAKAELRSDVDVTDSFNDYQVSRAILEYKESVCQVSEVTFDEGIMGSRPQKPFEFPDGYNNNFGAERYSLPEILYQPKKFLRVPNQDSDALDVTLPKLGMTRQQINDSIGIHHMVYQSVSSCDIDLRPLLFNNIVVTGGNTLFPGFNERLNYELPMLAPGSKVKIHAAGNQIERKCSSWLGGSILASLGTFHQLWVSKKEYDEVGASVIESKCQ